MKVHVCICKSRRGEGSWVEDVVGDADAAHQRLAARGAMLMLPAVCRDIVVDFEN